MTTTRTWADYAQELVNTGYSQRFAQAMVTVQQHLQRLDCLPSAPRIQAYLAKCQAMTLMDLKDHQAEKLASHLGRIQDKAELEQVTEPIPEPEDFGNLMAEIDVHIGRLNLTESSLMYQLALQIAGGNSRAVLDGPGLRKLLKILQSCDRVV